MKILVTGNAGYVGSVLARQLRRARPDAELVGYDAGYYAGCLVGEAAVPEAQLDRQYWGDVRDFDPRILSGVDAVVHLAAISNDPMGKRFEEVTHEINVLGGQAIARAAKASGVRAFVFASSCSVYGFSDGAPRGEGDPVNPLTAYARSKVLMERSLAALADEGFCVTALRFATACGMSERLRLDLVLNDFVAAALAAGEIRVLSDGTPWRPLIDVNDMARAIDWAIDRGPHPESFLAVNTGCDRSNYRVSDLAHAVADAIPGTQVSINRSAPADRRSYRVDFGLFEALAPGHQPVTSLGESIRSLLEGLRRAGFADRDFRSGHLIRLAVLNDRIGKGELSPELRWLGAMERAQLGSQLA